MPRAVAFLFGSLGNHKNFLFLRCLAAKYREFQEFLQRFYFYLPFAESDYFRTPDADYG